jgi:hypothetical protein
MKQTTNSSTPFHFLAASERLRSESPTVTILRECYQSTKYHQNNCSCSRFRPWTSSRLRSCKGAWISCRGGATSWRGTPSWCPSGRCVRSSSKVKQFRIERIPELLAHRIIHNPHQSRIINNETLHRRRVPNRPSIQAPIWSAIRSHRIPRRYYTLA